MADHLFQGKTLVALGYRIGGPGGIRTPDQGIMRPIPGGENKEIQQNSLARNPAKYGQTENIYLDVSPKSGP